MPKMWSSGTWSYTVASVWQLRRYGSRRTARCRAAPDPQHASNARDRPPHPRAVTRGTTCTPGGRTLRPTSDPPAAVRRSPGSCCSRASPHRLQKRHLTSLSPLSNWAPPMKRNSVPNSVCRSRGTAVSQNPPSLAQSRPVRASAVSDLAWWRSTRRVAHHRSDGVGNESGGCCGFGRIGPRSTSRCVRIASQLCNPGSSRGEFRKCGVCA